MKKRIVALAALVSLLLVGCGNASKEVSIEDEATPLAGGTSINISAEDLASLITNISADEDGNIILELVDGREFSLGNINTGEVETEAPTVNDVIQSASANNRRLGAVTVASNVKPVVTPGVMLDNIATSASNEEVAIAAATSAVETIINSGNQSSGNTQNKITWADLLAQIDGGMDVPFNMTFPCELVDDRVGGSIIINSMSATLYKNPVNSFNPFKLVINYDILVNSDYSYIYPKLHIRGANIDTGYFFPLFEDIKPNVGEYRGNVELDMTGIPLSLVFDAYTLKSEGWQYEVAPDISFVVGMPYPDAVALLKDLGYDLSSEDGRLENHKSYYVSSAGVYGRRGTYTSKEGKQYLAVPFGISFSLVWKPSPTPTPTPRPTSTPRPSSTPWVTVTPEYDPSGTPDPSPTETPTPTPTGTIIPTWWPSETPVPGNEGTATAGCNTGEAYDEPTPTKTPEPYPYEGQFCD